MSVALVVAVVVAAVVVAAVVVALRAVTAGVATAGGALAGATVVRAPTLLLVLGVAVGVGRGAVGALALVDGRRSVAALL